MCLLAGSLPEEIDTPFDPTNYNLHEIPVEQWNEYELLNLYVAPEAPKHCLDELCLWLEKYYDFEGKQFDAYISAEMIYSSGAAAANAHFYPDQPSEIVLYLGRNKEADELSAKIYAEWQAKGLAGRPGYCKIDADGEADGIVANID
jgi:hypothetical protein